jgi:benzodiazapine receptor
MGNAAAPRGSVRAVVLVATAWALAVAGLGGWATELGPWYDGLRQPPWKPPDVWFGPAWTTIYTLAAVAAVRAWMRARPPSARRALLAAYGLNGVLNVAWSALFFRLRRPDWALAEVVLLWLSIVLMIVVARRSDTVAAALLVPYLAWVSFAAALNLAVVRLNAPF